MKKNLATLKSLTYSNTVELFATIMYSLHFKIAYLHMIFSIYIRLVYSIEPIIGGIGITLTGLSQLPFYVCPKLEPVCLTSYIMFLYAQWVMRGNRLLCWYLWNCWPSIFKLCFHRFYNTFGIFLTLLNTVK